MLSVYTKELKKSKYKTACLFGQAAVSAIITAIYLVIPYLALRRLVPDIHLIRSYEGMHKQAIPRLWRSA